MKSSTHHHHDLQMEEWERSDQRDQNVESDEPVDPFEGATPLPVDDPFEMPRPGRHSSDPRA